MGAPSKMYVAIPKGRTLREAIQRGEVIWLSYHFVTSVSFQLSHPELVGTHAVYQLDVDRLFPT